jgi:hypothetical protein
LKQLYKIIVIDWDFTISISTTTTKYYCLYRFGYWFRLAWETTKYYYRFYSYMPIYSINGNVARFSPHLNRAHMGYDLGRKWATINGSERKWVSPFLSKSHLIVSNFLYNLGNNIAGELYLYSFSTCCMMLISWYLVPLPGMKSDCFGDTWLSRYGFNLSCIM